MAMSPVPPKSEKLDRIYMVFAEEELGVRYATFFPKSAAEQVARETAEKFGKKMIIFVIDEVVEPSLKVPVEIVDVKKTH